MGTTTLTVLGKRYEVAPQTLDRPLAGAARATGRRRVLLDENAARRFLQQGLARGLGMPELRRLLATRVLDGTVPRLSDGEVVDLVARRIAGHDLRVYAAEVQRYTVSLDAVDDAAGAIGPASTVDEAPVSEEADDRIDASAQAEALLAAARAGAPFCEECEKAKAAERAAAKNAANGRATHVEPPTEGDVANVDVAAQAAALKSAAADGVPFCEECEKAKRAAAAERRTSSGGG